MRIQLNFLIYINIDPNQIEHSPAWSEMWSACSLQAKNRWPIEFMIIIGVRTCVRAIENRKITIST